MTNSDSASDDEDTRNPVDISATSDQYRKIYQVIKEGPELSDKLLDHLGLDSNEAVSAVRAAREVGKNMESVSTLRIKVTDPDPEPRSSEPLFIEFSSRPSALDTYEATIDRRLFQTWKILAKSVLTSSSERELWLRTGYSSDELELAYREFFG
ncbi:hypothetical protein ACFXKD_09170 [Nocardiopsis aegyptia]|uniref:hypothetical protein n=1 Tax=Nocardiopsis aegyptia TaxID=220378 RepID=UPI00366D9516